MTTIALRVNGKEVSKDVEPRLLLVELLRENLHLTGTHVGCDTSQCGACTVMLDGNSIKSCTMLAVEANGREVTTIEGISTDGKLHTRAGSLPRASRSAVRLLHAGHGHQLDRSPEAQTESVRARDSRLARRQHLPLHRLPRHRQSSSSLREEGSSEHGTREERR